MARVLELAVFDRLVGGSSSPNASRISSSYRFFCGFTRFGASRIMGGGGTFLGGRALGRGGLMRPGFLTTIGLSLIGRGAAGGSGTMGIGKIGLFPEEEAPGVAGP